MAKSYMLCVGGANAGREALSDEDSSHPLRMVQPSTRKTTDPLRELHRETDECVPTEVYWPMVWHSPAKHYAKSARVQWILRHDNLAECDVLQHLLDHYNLRP